MMMFVRMMFVVMFVRMMFVMVFPMTTLLMFDDACDDALWLCL